MISFVPWISNWASNYKLYWLISDPTEPRKPLLPEKLLTNFTRKLSPFHSGRLACFYWQGRTKESNWNIGMDLWHDMTYVLIYEILCLFLTPWQDMTYHEEILHRYLSLHEHWTWSHYMKAVYVTPMLRLCPGSMLDFIFSILFSVSLAGFEQILQKRPSVFL